MCIVQGLTLPIWGQYSRLIHSNQLPPGSDPAHFAAEMSDIGVGSIELSERLVQ